MLLAAIITLFASPVFSTSLRRQSGGNETRNDGIHLAIGPKCGSLNGNFADVNSGLFNSDKYDTIVSFGDSYTDTGGNRDGTPPPPAVLIPPNPEAGGRSTNGYMWVEEFGFDHNITVMNYAISAAVTNTSLWPSVANNSDFIKQANLFLSQNHTLDPFTTLYVVFFGINDFIASQVDGDHLQAAAQTVLNQIDLLSSPPTNAHSFLVLDVYGIGQQAASGDAYKQTIFNGLAQRRDSYKSPPFRVGFVDFSRIWSAVRDNNPPGFAAFGYTNNDFCLIGPCCNPADICPDPDHTFYWIASHPAKQGQRMMADYVNEVLAQCRT